MSTTFDVAVMYVLRNEGGMASLKNDRGSITNFGISHAFLKTLTQEKLRSYGIFGDPLSEDTIKQLTIEQAKAIYKGEFWDHALFSAINNSDIGCYLFDMAVNMGISPAVKCIQRAVWAVLKQWQELPDDGVLGDKTISLINRCGFMMKAALRAERGAYYRACVVARPEDKEFLNGWFDRAYNT
jgi:lysozyme family protein